MPVSFETAAADVNATPIPLITIAGVGGADGLDLFCPRVPAYAAGDDRYKAWLLEETWPSQVPTELQKNGGVATSGSLAFTLVDGLGRSGDPTYDYLTARFGTDAEADFWLNADLTAGGGSLDVVGRAAALANLVVDSIVYVGAEALLVTGITTDTGTRKVVTVTRGVLDTDAAAHDEDDPAFLSIPYIAGRRVRLYVTYDPPGADATTIAEVGASWSLERADPVEGLQAYTISALSDESLTDRKIGRRLWTGSVLSVEGAGPRQILLQGREGGLSDTEAAHFDGSVWLEVDGEILLVEWPEAQRPTWLINGSARARGGTRRADIEPGQEARLVYLADTRGGFGSFRYQDPSSETSLRSTGTWQDTSHPIGILLCVLLGSAHSSDGLELTNYVSGSGNFSALPPGVGMGVPISRVDWASFHELWHLHPEWDLPHLVIREAKAGRDWLDSEILKPFGLHLVTINGLLTLLEDVPISTAEEGTAWGASDILLEETEPGRYEWVLEQTRDDAGATSSVVVEGKDAAGRAVRLEFNEASFPTLTGNVAGHFEKRGGELEIPVPGARFDGTGAEDVFERRAFAILYRSRRAPWLIKLSTTFAEVARNLWDPILLTHPELVDDRARARGWTSRPCRVISKTLDFEANKVDWVLLAYQASFKVGLISPAGIITSIAVDTLTLRTNRYTTANLPAGLGLVATDAEAFEVDDVVQLREIDGQIVATTPATQVVLSRSGDDVELDGDFGGATQVGRILTYADYDSQTTDQQTETVSLADGNDRLGASDDEAFTYGQAS